MARRPLFLKGGRTKLLKKLLIKALFTIINRKVIELFSEMNMRYLAWEANSSTYR